MRINGFEQMKAFYSWVFNNADKARATHISLYMFLLNQNNRANWVEWFKCPYDLAMNGAAIGSKSTYYKCLGDLQEWDLIQYEKGQNSYKAPLIKLLVLYKTGQLTGQVSVPLSEQVNEPQSVSLPVLLTGKKYKLLTSNLKRIIDNLSSVIDFLNRNATTGDWRTDFDLYKRDLTECYTALIKNPDFIQQQQKFHPGVNITLSLQKARTNFWATEAGWEHKKKSRIKTIDWKTTLTNAIDKNKVYEKNRTNNKNSFGSDTTRRTIEAVENGFT